MKALFSKPLISYVIGILLVIATTGFVLYQVIENTVILIAVLLIELIIFLLFLLHFHDKYMKPIKKATKTVDEIVKGNYRARFHHPVNDTIGELSKRVNALARNLSELSIQEQMQSEQLSTVIDNTESGLILIDSKGYIHLVNRKIIDMFGRTPKDYRGYLYYDVLDNEAIHTAVQKAFLYERNIKDAFTHYRGTEKFYLEIVGAPIFNERNMLKGAVLVIYDITEMKKLELMRKDFVANVSHELKTPITSIKGFAETLMETPLTDEQTHSEFLSIIYNESHRLQLLIEDLLILSKLEKEDFKLELENVHTSELMADITPLIKHQALEKGIQLTLDIDETKSFMADKERIKQVIMNLLDNAFNYTPSGGEVLLKIGFENDQLNIQVKDTGIGIDQEALPRIFERFYRVDKARSRNTGGTGLGLAIVKHIVEVHQGNINIESEQDIGTTITVSLPQHKE